jgi:hypothetical protein
LFKCAPIQKAPHEEKTGCFPEMEPGDQNTGGVIARNDDSGCTVMIDRSVIGLLSE